VFFLFDDHLGITKDPTFVDNLLYFLLESPRDSARWDTFATPMEPAR